MNLNVNNILAQGESHLDNEGRKEAWHLRLIKLASSPEKPTIFQCRMCKSEYTVTDGNVHVLGGTCCRNCEEDYQELRREGHWR